MRKVALVTGGGRGIGFGVAKRLALEEFDLVLSGRSERTQVEPAIQEIEAMGASVLYCSGDISCAEDRTALLEETKSHFGRLDLLVNNAGVAPKTRADILEATEESFEWVLKINLQGPYFLTQAVANWMIDQKNADENFGGCIINIGSLPAVTTAYRRLALA
jgi:3-oxoacyl-[acyl-carrier protein] reductase